MTRYRTISLVKHPRYYHHDTGGNDHPEIPARLRAIGERLHNGPLGPYLSSCIPEAASRSWILKAHDESYLFHLEETALSGRAYLDHPDNQLCYESYEIVQLAAGAGLTGADLLESGTAALAFCCVRPPGHHAERAAALGFCFLNNAVIAARYWQEVYGRRKIMIIDFDAHHGNGIQAAFEEDAEIFYISLHEHPSFSFPGTGYAEETGSGAGRGATLNIPLPPGSGDAQVLAAFTEKVEPAVNRFAPEALLVCAGFDGHYRDDMSGLAYTTAGFGLIGESLARLAAAHCGGRALILLEGGYHLAALAEGVERFLLAMAAQSQEE